MKHLFQIITILSIMWLPSRAQEYLSGLDYNGTILQKRREAALIPVQKDSRATGSIELPFLDDFSGSLYYPSPQLWQDSSAFVNLDYGVEEPSTGVVTLDAIDKYGAIYPDALSSAFKADNLTSRPIRLDSLFNPIKRPIRRSDSPYLSFYYQPQGKGTAPAKNDSLILQFHSPLEVDTIITSSDTLISPVWRNVWYSTGMSLDTFRVKYGRAFRQVLIPITDSASYYRDGFQFRFINYASLANNILPSWQSNGDQWNIDYVYLNTGRSINDTISNDIAFAGRAPSMLRNYEAMPYSQYRANYIEEMQDSLHMFISDLDSAKYQISYHYKVTRDFGIPVYTYSGGSFYIPTFATSGYSSHPPFAHPPVNFLYPIGNQQKVVFKTVHFLTTDPNLILKSNDTLKYTQVFSNYFAYDDGTAEAGYGLSPAGSKLAYEFRLNADDSLRAVQMYINQSRTGGNLQYFTLTVWKSDAIGKPGDIVFEKKGVKAYFTDSLNKYQTISLDTVLFIDNNHFPDRVFFIGWQQTTDDNLNVGFDRYNDASRHIFYNTSGTWLKSTFKGALMIRPIVGLENPVGILQPGSVQNSFEVYPNPTSEFVYFDIPESCRQSERNGHLRIIIRDMAGRTTLNRQYSQSIDVSRLSPGAYLVCLADDQTNTQFFRKLLVNR
jgi:hypothetical protein